MKGRLLRRLLGTLSFSGNVWKHSLECFASGRIGVFLRRVSRLGFFAFSGRFRVGRLHFFLRNHRTTLRQLQAKETTANAEYSIHLVLVLRAANLAEKITYLSAIRAAFDATACDFQPIHFTGLTPPQALWNRTCMQARRELRRWRMP